MISLCYLIVCVYLLYSSDQAETFSTTKSWLERRNEQALLMNLLTLENQDESLAKLITPFYNMTYNEQLLRKENCCRPAVNTIASRSKRFSRLMPLKLHHTIPSPVTKAYRNRDQFDIRRGVDGNRNTVGCTVGNVTLGTAFSIHPTKIVTIKESHKRVAQVYEDFIRLSSVPASNRQHDGGHWRSLNVRSNEAGEIMATVTVQPIGYNTSTIKKQRESLKEYFMKQLPNITLFYHQCPYKRCRSVAAFVLLYGKPYLIETLNGYKFKIFPDSTFQINKLAAEVFYDTIIKTAKLKPNTTVLDICSGTGVISIMASKFVKEVVGIESNLEAVTEAKQNVEFNNISNVKFQLGDAEVKLKSLLNRLEGSEDIVAIINPGPTQSRMKLITTIRKHLKISRVVYLSVNPNCPFFIQNSVILQSARKLKIPPFVLTEAIPVDLLPQTAHVQIILFFQRALK